MIRINKNHLDVDTFSEIQNRVFSPYFAYYLQNGVANYNDGDSYFTHTLINDDGEVVSEHIDILQKIMSNVSHSKIRSAIINLYPKTEKIQEHQYHYDLTDDDNNPDEELIVGLFYLNTNNGGTQFYKNETIMSEENKLVLFNNRMMHRSTTCTNDISRIVVNINFYDKKN